MQDLYMDSDELAKFIKLPSRAAVHTLVNRRRIPHLKVGHRLLFDRNEIERWLQSQTRLTADQVLHTEAV